MQNNKVSGLFVLAQSCVFDSKQGLLKDIYDESDNVYMNTSEVRLLLFLISKTNQVLSREEILKSVWLDHGECVVPTSLTQTISVLRKKLNDSPKDPKFIMTIPKVGYKFICSVEKQHSRDIKAKDEVSFGSEPPLPANKETKRSLFSPLNRYVKRLFR